MSCWWGRHAHSTNFWPWSTKVLQQKFVAQGPESPIPCNEGKSRYTFKNSWTKATNSWPKATNLWTKAKGPKFVDQCPKFADQGRAQGQNPHSAAKQRRSSCVALAGAVLFGLGPSLGSRIIGLGRAGGGGAEQP